MYWFKSYEEIAHSIRKQVLFGLADAVKALHNVNPQKVVRLSFPTLVFFVRLSFEVFLKLLRLGKIFLTQIKILRQGFQKWLKIENWSCGSVPRPN